MITVHQCRFIICNKSTSLVGDVDNKGSYACMDLGGWVGVYDFSVVSSSGAVNLKLL